MAPDEFQELDDLDLEEDEEEEDDELDDEEFEGEDDEDEEDSVLPKSGLVNTALAAEELGEGSEMVDGEQEEDESEGHADSKDSNESDMEEEEKSEPPRGRQPASGQHKRSGPGTAQHRAGAATPTASRPSLTPIPNPGTRAGHSKTRQDKPRVHARTPQNGGGVSRTSLGGTARRRTTKARGRSRRK
jgi:hypothetical protein